MARRETENNAYAKFWGDKQKTLWYVMVFSGVVNCQQDQAKLPLPSPPLHTRQLTRQSRGDSRLGQGAKQPKGARW